ncbi:hypothetical protein [Fictibacillus phosphorivorans]|nr:hypothetical protein [Fictibacillus phosphorivorans]MCM3718867.1 hypothetical protein [Fictibacillus phosphorivorans]MCM3776489.1 hypothetical protein [Fictibacillus phosphorivorans]
MEEGEDAFDVTLTVGTRSFYRVEVWRYFPQVKTRLLAALSNPIYFSGFE